MSYVKGDFAGTSETLGKCISISKNGGVTNWANHGGTAKKGYFLQTDLYAAISAEGGNTTPVGSYPANSLGLYDMAGNCWDLTSSSIVAVNGLEQGVTCYAVRGGSWYATARSCTFTYRGEGRKDHPSATVGFRLAADYVGTNAEKTIVLTIGRTDAMVFGEKKINDTAPILAENRTMLPARFVAENLGATVEWIPEGPGRVRITRGETELLLEIGSTAAYVNGELRWLDSPPFIQNDRTYTPVRFICEALGASVAWDGTTGEVTITVP